MWSYLSVEVCQNSLAVNGVFAKVFLLQSSLPSALVYKCLENGLVDLSSVSRHSWSDLGCTQMVRIVHLSCTRFLSQAARPTPVIRASHGLSVPLLVWLQYWIMRNARILFFNLDMKAKIFNWNILGPKLEKLLNLLTWTPKINSAGVGPRSWRATLIWFCLL